MANLLVTMIAIGLVSVISVMGITYIGNVYNESQANAQATQLISSAAKVASAMRSWSRTNGSTTFSDTNWSDGTATDLINSNNQYLDNLPQLGSYAQGNGSSDVYFKAMPLANVAWVQEGLSFDSLFAVITSRGVCNAVARLARGDSATPTARTGVSGATMVDFSGVMANGDFNCAYNDANSNGTLDSGESMFFLYKVF